MANVIFGKQSRKRGCRDENLQVFATRRMAGADNGQNRGKGEIRALSLYTGDESGNVFGYGGDIKAGGMQ